MSAGSLVTILFSLALASAVAFLGNAWLDRKLGASDGEVPETATVVAAAKDIPVATSIDQTYLRMLQVPRALVPEGAVSAADELLGRSLKEPVYTGEIIVSKRLLSGEESNILSAMLAPGMRAITVRINDVSGVSGFLRPGSRVDVISTPRGGKARTVLQDLKILAVGQALQAAREGAMQAKAVTLEVNPRQAELLAEATESGDVRLTLRHQSDRVQVDAGTGGAQVGGLPAPVSESAALASALGARMAGRDRDSSFHVTVIRGTRAELEGDLSLTDDKAPVARALPADTDTPAAEAPQVIR